MPKATASAVVELEAPAIETPEVTPEVEPEAPTVEADEAEAEAPKLVRVRIERVQYRGGQLNGEDWPLPGVHDLVDHAATALIADGLATEVDADVELGVDAEFSHATQPIVGETPTE